ncbi:MULTISPECIES: AAA-like domain-containing protein [unclassified Leptolyngbya]|uniref:AAA-like domain-containing protein n=1 Tax=unclassified Leptolyngbya TaxID=2650499 RepID=UPI0016877A0A|nr:MULTISPECIES: AAA-like domain-containing protein [unclassified Leptolyngbya]MBD1912578.1 AAA-like domain-containing protein [Leptolyngbya sp. FACHB-8]MBD2158488.1 AAA-like domain-containing protein [Leptolyngbya sp. FACHB-16]
MDVNVALEFTENLIFNQTGKHLSDLERDIFIGSWQQKTYEEIYPSNPEYVEKYVGYKFWQKLSAALGEKVTKKMFRGALERAFSQTSSVTEGSPAIPIPSEQRVFISYQHQKPDIQLAQALKEAIAAEGYSVFLNPDPPADSAKDWLTRLNTHLSRCHYFLVLLSPQAVFSEMVLEELRRVKELQELQGNQIPTVLAIQINCPPNMPLNVELQNYLSTAHQWSWRSPQDTHFIIKDILTTLGSDSTNSSHLLPAPSCSPPPPLPYSPAPLPPYPVADPEVPQGQVRLDSPFYVERSPYEAQCYREIMEPGTLIRIKAPRQMGKTSLMSRILERSRERGLLTVPLSFQHADKAVFENLNHLLQWFCGRIARRLHLPYSVEHVWSDTYGSKDNCTAYFEDCLLSEIETPLVLALDEVDRVFQYPKIADDFFGLLRAWYEEAGYGSSDSQLWEKLRLIVVHSTEVYIPLDVNQSPFNVGLPIELSEFSAAQVHDLSLRHGLNWSSREVEQLMQMVGGHPYLVRVALYHIAQQQLTLDKLLETAPTEAGVYGDHLRRHLWNLQNHPDLATAFQRVVTTDEPVELASMLAFKLHSLGLVELMGNEVISRFQLYQRYFRDRILN